MTLESWNDLELLQKYSTTESELQARNIMELKNNMLQKYDNITENMTCHENMAQQKEQHIMKV